MSVGDEYYQNETQRKGAEMMRSLASEPFGMTSARLFRISCEPSFDGWWTIQLLKLREHKADSLVYLVTRRVWANAYGTINGEPEITTEHRLVEGSVAELWQSSLVNISVPITYEGLSGLDGTGYQLDLGDTFTSIRLRWWSDGPREWRPVTQKCMEISSAVSALNGWSKGPVGPSGRVNAVVVFSEAPPPAIELYAVRKLHWRWSTRMPSEILSQVVGRELFLCATDYSRAPEIQRRAAEANLQVDIRFIDE